MQVPLGFQLSGAHCGIKDSDQEDLTLIVSQRPATAAGVYTQNVVYSPSVGRNRQLTPADNVRVIVANSGNANTCTGRRGEQDNQQMAHWAAQACGAQADQALVMSTGIIGEYLPMDKISQGITSAAQQLGSDEEHLLAAARGLMTTDTLQKIASQTVSLSTGEIRVTGMAKGAGMIGPNMATMLAAIITDAALTPQDAQNVLSSAVDESFNCISVEGHMSTSDTVLLMASGAATDGPLEKGQLEVFREALTQICIQLARLIPSDGEGASHLIQIEVTRSASRQEAHQIAKTIANSALVKTGIAGADPNWGRIVSAAGYSGVKFDPERLSLRLNDTLVYDQGVPVDFDAEAVSHSIRDNHETRLKLAFAEGDASCRFWTSDLTVDYVRFNSDYHT